MVCSNPVPRLTAVTAAFGITEPLASFTVPEISPPSPAHAEIAAHEINVDRSSNTDSRALIRALPDRSALGDEYMNLAPITFFLPLF
jgi:hypothetical protein